MRALEFLSHCLCCINTPNSWLCYVKRLALISCAFYFKLLISLCYVFKTTQKTAGSKTSLLLLSGKIREKQTCTWAVFIYWGGGTRDQLNLFMLIIDFFVFWVIKYYWSPFLGEIKLRPFVKNAIFKGAPLFKELVGSFHHAHFKAGLISVISKFFFFNYSVVLLFMKLACPQTTIFWL